MKNRKVTSLYNNLLEMISLSVKLCVSAALKLEDYVQIGPCPMLDIKNKPKSKQLWYLNGHNYLKNSE